jgi:hypothetical protein
VLLVRIIGLATAIALGVSVLLWLVTGERKWLRIAWRVFKYALFLVLLILLLFLAERLLVTV